MQVDKVRNKGITGEGIKIAMIDTGVSGSCLGIQSTLTRAG